MSDKIKIKWEQTKIIATIGPASSSMEVLKKMVIEGMDVCRINFSHGSYEEHLKVIKTIRNINAEYGTHIPILADLQGPKIRTGLIENDEIVLEDGSEIIITTQKCIGNNKKIQINYGDFPKDVKVGERILIDDGKLALDVVSTDGKKEVVACVKYGGTLSSKKGVNLPNTKISLPCLTPKDLEDLEFALENKVEWIGLSFVRSASDLIELKHLIANNPNHNNASIIAKIEKPEALENLDDIIEQTDAVMVARGDLGVEIPLQNVPLEQKNIVKKCLKASKPVIIATQMMESMITNFNPSRAEVNDVANAVADGADALMLSGETSVGKFPIRVIENMQKIIHHIEAFDDIYHKHDSPKDRCDDRFITDSICYNACNMAQQVNAKAIIGFTYSGYSAYRIASHRPRAGIFIFTNNRELLNTINLIWGVRGFYYDKFISVDHTVDDIKFRLRKEGYIKQGDPIINVSSTPIDTKGKINMMKLCRA